MKNLGFAKLDRLACGVVAAKIVDFLNFLFTDVEEIANYFKRLLDINDGILDFGPDGVFQREQVKVLILCMDKTFIIIKSLFAWHGFLGKDQRALLKKALAVVAQRTSRQWTVRNSVEELVNASIKHLSEFSPAIIDISCANSLGSNYCAF